MNSRQQQQATDRALCGALGDVPETPVDEALHRRVMAAVESQQSHAPGRQWQWATAGALAMGLAVIGGVQWLGSPAPEPIDHQPSTRLLSQRVAQLEKPVALPEAALRQEYERLKSDLRKLGIDT